MTPRDCGSELRARGCGVLSAPYPIQARLPRHAELGDNSAGVIILSTGVCAVSSGVRVSFAVRGSRMRRCQGLLVTGRP